MVKEYFHELLRKRKLPWNKENVQRDSDFVFISKHILEIKPAETISRAIF